MNSARAVIENAIPSVGRINLANHRLSWVATGWVIAENIVATNRHVARVFAQDAQAGFDFIQDFSGKKAKASIDMYREHQTAHESLFRMREVLWIEPYTAGSHDVAFLRVDPTDENDLPQPPALGLMSDADFAQLDVTRWLAIIGYPGYSFDNDRQDQQRIFEGVFGVKRLQPGQLSAITDSEINHDATTLGGNSGSAVLDLMREQVIGLHFGGFEGKTNSAVPAPVVRRLLREHVGVEI